jgi:hypothetical protein
LVWAISACEISHLEDVFMKLPVVLMVIVCATLSSQASQTVGPPRAGVCVLWEHREMQGARMRLPHGDRVSFAREAVGNSSWRESPTWNDVVSSATLDSGCTLRVWEHSLAGGESREWRAGGSRLLVKYVGDRWNDRISSATCLCD